MSKYRGSTLRTLDTSEFDSEPYHWQDRQLYCAHLPAHRYTLLWPVGMGPRETFLDRWELLCRVDPEQCINDPAAYLSMHGKSAWLDYAPTTHIASDPETLADALTGALGKDHELLRDYMSEINEYLTDVPKNRRGPVMLVLIGHRVNAPIQADPPTGGLMTGKGKNRNVGTYA